MNIEERYLNELRKQISAKFGREIKSASHCNDLAAAVEREVALINPQTFRRFYGLIKSTGGFSLYTLDTLAEYCGHQNFTAFKNSLVQTELDLFLDTHGTHYSSSDYWELSEDLCRKIIDSPTLLANIHHKLLKYPLARTFFMEHHPMRDLSGTVYSQYFQDYLKFEQSNEAKLFAYGFLYMGVFLTLNEEFMEIYAQKISDTECGEEVYLLPAGRKYGVALLHSWLKKDENQFQLAFNEMKVARNLYKSKSEKSVCSFEYAVLEHLIFTDKTDEMLFLIENNTFQRYNDRKFITQDRKENHEVCWNVMCAVAYFRMGNTGKCKYYLSTINLDLLSVGWKKYYTILYYFVQIEFAGKEDKKKIVENLTHLIDETHFSYFGQKLTSLQRKN